MGQSYILYLNLKKKVIKKQVILLSDKPKSSFFLLFCTHSLKFISVSNALGFIISWFLCLSSVSFQLVNKLSRKRTHLAIVAVMINSELCQNFVCHSLPLNIVSAISFLSFGYIDATFIFSSLILNSSGACMYIAV